MIRSMTGYGRGTVSDDGAGITVEIRSVNSRQREVRCRLPQPLLALEAAVRERVQAEIARGRVDVYVSWDRRGADAVPFVVNVDGARAMLEAWRRLQTELGLSDEPRAEAILRMPGVVESARGEEPDLDHVQRLLLAAAEEALQQLIRAREREGYELLTDLAGRTESVGERISAMRSRLDTAPERQAELLRERVQQLLQDVPLDESRLAQEIAIAAQRADATEELVRLDAHVARMRGLLVPESSGVGRELEFVVQEMRREINTLGVKASDPDVDADVLAAKTELEKIREQAANLE
ncbi:MAG: YicC family protein [Acidobacteriota bacterium]|nr:YicC family protein [Acidobacteriota bacterium]